MTTLAAVPVMDDQLDLLTLVADNTTPLGRLRRDDFEQACRAVAVEGWVHPSYVSAELHRRFGDVNPRWLSAMWSSATSRGGFMDNTDEWRLIDSTHSRGNGNKKVRLRRLRGVA